MNPEEAEVGKLINDELTKEEEQLPPPQQPEKKQRRRKLTNSDVEERAAIKLHNNNIKENRQLNKIQHAKELESLRRKKYALRKRTATKKQKKKLDVLFKQLKKTKGKIEKLHDNLRIGAKVLKDNEEKEKSLVAEVRKILSDFKQNEEKYNKDLWVFTDSQRKLISATKSSKSIEQQLQV